jgi:prophage DNA circulation protein
MSFWDDLQQATFNGLPFGVDVSASRKGRRVALHEYAFRDDPWPEDIGRRAREHRITGFLLEYDQVYQGGPVIQQLKDFESVVEVEGPSQLVHPIYGTLSGSIVDFESVSRKELGLVIEIRFVFIEGGVQRYPDDTTSTLDAVTAAASAADAAASSDFISRAETALAQGSAVVQQAVSTATAWAAQAQGLVNDASNVFKFVYRLQGPYGRFFGGRLTGFNPSAALQTVQQTSMTVSSLIAEGSMLRNGVNNAAADLITVAQELGV